MTGKFLRKVGALIVLLMAMSGVAASRSLSEGPAIKVSIAVDAATPAGVLDHSWEVMTGSGNASLYIREGWGEKILAHLADVHDHLGIQSVRFHGIFGDKIGIYQGPGQYDFSKADQIYDRVLAVGVKPFVELSFMPEQLASGRAVGFPLGYRPFISPPRSYEEWGKMVEAFARHLVERYGLAEVKTWYFEVWNEPDLSVFWSGNRAEYFRLYDVTAKAVKAASPELKVGGPATSQSAWILEFSRHCRETQVPVDFVSTHGYYGDQPVKLLPQVRAAIPEAERDLTGGRFHDALDMDNRIIAKIFGQPLPLFFTEWGSSAVYSYSISRMTNAPNDHDLPNDAAFMAKAVKEANGLAAGFSHWTHSDVFEEWGLPGTQWPVKKAAFHGGFGIITVDGIHKPAYHAFAFLHQMGSGLVKTTVIAPRPEVDALATLDADRLAVIAWYYLNTVAKREKSGPSAKVTLQLSNLPAALVGKKLLGFRIDATHGNPYAEWLKMGEPGNLSPDQITALKKISDDTLRAPELDRRIDSPNLTLEFPLDPAALVFLITEHE